MTVEPATGWAAVLDGAAAVDAEQRRRQDDGCSARVEGLWPLRRHPGIDAPGHGAAIDHEAVERRDLPVARPGTGKGRVGRAQHADVVDRSFARIDHRDVWTAHDEVVRHPAADWPFLCRRRVETHA